VEMGRRRVRRAQPRSQASSVVKCSNTREESMRDMDSSCASYLSAWIFGTRWKGGGERGGEGRTHVSRRRLYRPRALWALSITHPSSSSPLFSLVTIQQSFPLLNNTLLNRTLSQLGLLCLGS
jgi:hypothetical protein